MTNDELREALREMGMKQRRLAVDLGMTEAQISRYVRGSMSRYSGQPIRVPEYVAAYMRVLRENKILRETQNIC